MQLEQVDGTDERIAVTAICLSTEVLKRSASGLAESPFSAKWSNIIGSWCLRHFEQFHEAPGAAVITSIYSEWARSADEATKSLVGAFLGSLRPLSLNDDYCVDLIERIATRNAAKQLCDRVTAALSNGKLQAATDAIAQFKAPTLAQACDYIEPFSDLTSVSEAFNKTKYESIIKFRAGSAMQRWIGPTLHRDALVTLVGPDKSGKSSHLAAFCQMAVVQGLRTAFFNLGDLSQEQCLKRWSTAFVNRPGFPGEFKIPTAVKYVDKELEVTFDTRFATHGYTEDEARSAWTSVAERGEANRLRVITKPARSLSVEEIDNKLDAWAQKGWLPDVVGIDYAGLLHRKNGVETHEAIDHNWAQLRAISSKYKILVLTAEQVKASGYTKQWLGKEDFAGSKGINAHCNAIIGINMSELERAQQVARFNYIALREADYLTQLPSRYIAVAGCPIIGRFHLVSEFI